jgi:hypothetical protein
MFVVLRARTCTVPLCGTENSACLIHKIPCANESERTSELGGDDRRWLSKLVTVRKVERQQNNNGNGSPYVVEWSTKAVRKLLALWGIKSRDDALSSASFAFFLLFFRGMTWSSF